MKKFLSLFCTLCIVHCVFSQGMMDIYGTSYQVDTIEYKQVGPGTMYCHAELPAISQDIYILTIDLENEYTEIETFLGKDCIAGTELVTSACNRHTQPGHDGFAYDGKVACASHNDGYFFHADVLLICFCGKIQKGALPHERIVRPDGRL